MVEKNGIMVKKERANSLKGKMMSLQHKKYSVFEWDWEDEPARETIVKHVALDLEDSQ